MLVRITNSEYPDQTALFVLAFLQTTSVRNFRTATILEKKIKIFSINEQRT